MNKVSKDCQGLYSINQQYISTSQGFLLHQVRGWIIVSFLVGQIFSSDTLQEEFPQLNALARSPQAMVRDCWDDRWNPTLEGILSHMKAEELMNMQQSLIRQRNHSPVPVSMETEDPTKGADFWVVAHQAMTGDTCLSKENGLGNLGRGCYAFRKRMYRR